VTLIFFKKEMRNAFVKSIIDLAEEDERVFLLVADIGTYLLREFKMRFPKRFINVGIAEANMIGVAAGLAMTGKIPFVYTITPFVTARCLDQIRVDVCYQNLNVRIVGVGSGISYGRGGPTHHSLTDIAIMRALPNMTVVSPSDPMETEKLIEATGRYSGPVYIRLPLAGDPVIHQEDYSFSIGKAEFIREGKDLALIGNGVMVYHALRIARLFGIEWKSSAVLNMHTIKPIDKEAILKVANEIPLIATIEEHSILGGLGSAVAEVLAENSFQGIFRRFGFQDQFCSQYGEKGELYEQYGISSHNIFKNLSSLLGVQNR